MVAQNLISRIEQATAVLTKLTLIRRENNIAWIEMEAGALPYHIHTSACMLATVDSRIKRKTFEIMCSQKLLNSSYKGLVINEDVRRKIQGDIGEYGELLP